MFVFFFFKQKTAYDMRISDWSSDVCSSDLEASRRAEIVHARQEIPGLAAIVAGKEIDPHIAARIALAAGNAQYPAVGQHVAARIEPAMPAEARRIRIFSVGGAERILFRRDIGEKAEFRVARRSSEERRVGTEWVGTCASRWARIHKKKNKTHK